MSTFSSPLIGTGETQSDAPAKSGFDDTKETTDGGEEKKTDDAAKKWISRIEKCKRVRKDMVYAWSDSVDYRRGKPFSEYDDEDRINVNIDWSMTKGKHAQLYSQTPQVYLTAKQKKFEPAVPVFTKQLNETLDEASVGAAMDETIIDCINASGFGISLVGYEALTQPKQVPSQEISKLPLHQLIAMKAGLMKVPMETINEKVSERYYIHRLSPSDFLWPIEFMGSNFDDADWLGHSGRMLWSEAKRRFKLKDEEKEKLVGAQSREENLRQDDDKSHAYEGVVEFDELFYWCHRFDPECKNFKQIGHVVFVKGKGEPVVGPGPWDGQRFDEQSKQYIGACQFPLRVLTLT